MPTRGRPFQTGNRFGKGRPRGSRNKTTIAAMEMIHSYSEPLIRKAISMALQGDTAVMKPLLDRIVPVARETPVSVGRVRWATIEDLTKAGESVLARVASGDLLISEARGLAELIDGQRRVLETEELERRIRALETKN